MSCFDCILHYEVQKKNVSESRNLFYFYVLLTVHLSIILVIDQLNAHILVFNKFIIFLYIFRTL